jgi:hypothetical protein
VTKFLLRLTGKWITVTSEKAGYHSGHRLAEQSRATTSAKHSKALSKSVQINQEINSTLTVHLCL